MQRLDIVLLGLLREAPRTGYDIRKWLDRNGWPLGYTAQTSQIYRQLGRLVERGWARSQPDPRRSGPDARLYGLTDAGIEALEAWVDSPYEPAQRPMDPDFQVRMFFSQHRGPEFLLRLVRAELAYRRQQHGRVLDLSPADAPSNVWAAEVRLLLHQRGRALAATLIAWLEATEERLALLTTSAASPAAPLTAQSAIPQEKSP